MRLFGSLFCLLTVLHAYAPELASSDVADAAEHLTGQRAHMTHEIRLIAGRRLEGPAITLRLVRDDAASSAAAGLAAIQLLENAAAGSVVVAALDDEKGFAVFGASFAVLARSHQGGNDEVRCRCPPCFLAIRELAKHRAGDGRRGVMLGRWCCVLNSHVVLQFGVGGFLHA